MWIPLHSVETHISMEWSLHSQGSVVQFLYVFYPKGLSTCNSTACFSLAAQFSHWSHNRSVFAFSYHNIFLFLWKWPLLLWESPFFHHFPTFWLLSGPNGMHADSLTGCSTCSQNVLPSALNSIVPIKADNLSVSWRHLYRSYSSLCARVLVKHLMLMEAGPESAHLWILSLLSSLMATTETSHFPFLLSPVFIFAEKLLRLPVYATSYGACW